MDRALSGRAKNPQCDSVHGYLAETVEKHFQPQPVKNVRINCVPETKPLGTAGGFLNAIHGEKDNPQAWLVLNGDSLATAPLEDFFQTLDDGKTEGAILGVRVPDASRFGTISQNERGELTGFNEKKSGAGIINAGVYLFRANVIEIFQRNSLSFETGCLSGIDRQRSPFKVC